MEKSSSILASAQTDMFVAEYRSDNSSGLNCRAWWRFVRVVFCPSGFLSGVGIFSGLLSGGLLPGIPAVHLSPLLILPGSSR